jgi:pyridoxamine 5'-phosphate oxidase family protein
MVALSDHGGRAKRQRVYARASRAAAGYRKRRNAGAGARVGAGMSVFTQQELDYLAGQRLGRIATVGPDGQPHVVPTGFRYSPEHDTIEVGGLRMSQTKKVRDVRHAGRAAIVVDDVLPPWQPRMIEIRGTAEVLPVGGKAIGDNMDDTIIRIHPRRIISFGINPGDAVTSARSVASA